MGWASVLQKLMQGLQSSTSGEGDVTARDVTLGPMQENRGLGNILNNFDRIGANRRIAAKGLREGDEDRAANLDLKKAQAENLRSLGSYRQAQQEAANRRNEIALIRAQAYAAKTDQEIRDAAQKLMYEGQRAQAAIQQAQASLQRATAAGDATEIAQQRLALDLEKFNYQQVQDTFDNNVKLRTVATQEGYLGIAQQKTQPEIERTQSETALNQSNAALNEYKAPLLQLEGQGKAIENIGAGQKFGLLNQPGSKNAATNTGVFSGFGVNPPSRGLGEFIQSFLPGAPKQASVKTPASPNAPPKVPAAPKPTGKIKVRRKADGKEGEVSPQFFDPNKYEKI